MSHIHTEPNQHDMTVSGYILRKDKGEWQCLVHMHRKIDMLMQIGGHIELDETPWQSMAKELREETGYDISEVLVLQPTEQPPQIKSGIVHPVPFLVNTHNVGNEHYHSDLCYGFIADKLPSNDPAEMESEDLRWYSVEELRALTDEGMAIADVGLAYEFLISLTANFTEVPASIFSLEKPLQGLSYKR